MRERTFNCAECGDAVTVPVKPGRPQIYCAPCRASRHEAHVTAVQSALKAQTKARSGGHTCDRCGGPIPPGSRADRRWCSRACQGQAARRATGAVRENHGICVSCGTSLLGRQSNATTCGAVKCLGWAQRHPGVLHPSARPRTCERCGVSIDDRNAKARWCSITCKNTAWAEANPEKAAEIARRYYQSEHGKAYARAFRQENGELRRRWARDARLREPERYRNYWKQWAEANPDALRDLDHLRRARKKGNPGSVGVSIRDWERLVGRYGGCCAYCGATPDVLHMDHVVPLAKGGRHAIGNVLPACPECNFSKHAFFLSVWRYRGRRLLLGA